jgi:transposase-like protein
MSTTRRVFPEVFKREAVDRVISSGLPVGKVATELGLNETVLKRWVMRLGGHRDGSRITTNFCLLLVGFVRSEVKSSKMRPEISFRWQQTPCPTR